MTGNQPVYREAAETIARLLAERKLGLVYGGGHVGMMGALADAVLEAGGDVIGVIPKALFDKELAHDGLHRLHVVDSMHERKALMADLSDAFIGLPGGFGTFEEFFEIITWSQLGLHRKPCGLLNVGGYYDLLLQMCDHAVASGFVRADDRARILSETDPERLLDLMLAHKVPATTKWIRSAET